MSTTNIVDYTRNNTMATAIMLDVLSRCSHGVERIAVASSMSVYGEGEYWSLRQQKTSLAPLLAQRRAASSGNRGASR